jgi:hypothetical protein
MYSAMQELTLPKLNVTPNLTCQLMSPTEGLRKGCTFGIETKYCGIKGGYNLKGPFTQGCFASFVITLHLY